MEHRGVGITAAYTNKLSLANFVGIVVGFLNVLTIRLRSPLLAASLSFETEMVFISWPIFLPGLF
jgi:hypothetical protein